MAVEDVSLRYNNLGDVITPVTEGFGNYAFNNLLGVDSNWGGGLGTLFAQGSSAALGRMGSNLYKGQSLFEGVGQDAGQSLAGAGVGILSNWTGRGITSAMGDSTLGRGVGAGTSTALGIYGGNLVSRLLGKNTTVNPYGAAMSIAGTALGAMTGPSKEYGGTYGNITRTMDSIYDAATAGANFIPGVGQGISAAMTLNKGLSNVFGSTDGMCVCAGTKVFTNIGEIVNIEDLVLDLGIIGWDEKSHNILPNSIAGIVEPKLKECLEIELKNGTILRCSIDHPILSNVKEKAESHRINGKRIAYREWSFRRADELKVGNWIGLANNIDYWGTEEMPNAYLVGMLIGDGTYTYESSCKLWTADPSTWKYLEDNNLAVLIGQYTPENSNGKYSIENRDYRIINGMLLVKNLGIAYQKGKEKTLPKNIGKYTKDSICKMIAGLYDTDGSISVNEEKGEWKITFYLSSLDLLDNIKLLLLKLGIFSTIYKRKASVNKLSNGRTINSNESYRLEITDMYSANNFYNNISLNVDYKKEHLERIHLMLLNKKSQEHNDLSGAKQYKIISIKSIGVQTVYNLEASETHTYIANGIITHNTKADAILGSAWMPFFVKWGNMIGSKKTDKFMNQSWLNQEKATTFMQNRFGDLNLKFEKARRDSEKVFGGGYKFLGFKSNSKKYNAAQENIAFANPAWEQILEMADQRELLDVSSQYMSSINNLRYANLINGGFNLRPSGKQGMKILNNATNHNIGLRLLSAAALIDNKAMILCNAHD